MVQKQLEKVKQQHIVIYAGFDRTWDDIIQDWNASNEEYEATDITNATLTMIITDNQGTTFLTKTNGSGITITDAPNGVYEVEFADIDTDSDDRGVYTYQIVCQLEGGEKYPTLGGIFTIV